MAFKQGEIYKCPDEQCGCELTVLRVQSQTAKEQLHLPAAAVNLW